MELLNKSSDNFELDSLVNPCIFNIRHYGELMFKDSIRKAKIYLGEIDVDQIGFISEHTYHKLFAEFERYLLKLELITRKDDLTEMLDFVYFFNRNDVDSYAFRYPFEKEMNSSNSIKYILHPMEIDTFSFQTNFEKFENCIEGFNELLTRMLDNGPEVID